MTLDGRLRLLQAAAAAVLLLLGAQLVRLQLTAEEEVAATLVSGEFVRAFQVTPPRGLIYDRNGVPLAGNVPSYFVAIVPADLPADEQSRRLDLRTIERVTGVAYSALERASQRGLASVDPLAPITIADGVTAEAAVSTRAALASIPAVQVGARPRRTYEGGDLLAHMLGYTGAITPDDVAGYLDAGYPLDARVGRSGLELFYESLLRGEPGRRLALADASGRELRPLSESLPRSGVDLWLSIDLELQRAVAAALADGIAAGLRDREPDARPDAQPPIEAGAAVVMDVRTGELLALVSLPSFDANLFANGVASEQLDALLSDPNRPLIDRSYMEVAPPGSIFKILVAAAALQEGVATPDTRITSTGAISVQDEYQPDVRYVFRDWAAHGTLDLYGGISRSSDVYFYYLAGGYRENGRQLFDGLGAERIARYAVAAGLGERTGIDLPGEARGLVPAPAWKEQVIGDPWVLGDSYIFGIGQGYLTVTPLQMAVATAALANGGEVLVPRIVGATSADGMRSATSREMQERLPVDAEHMAVVREAMRRAANCGGTALRGEPAGVTIGGKTGTAEFGPRRADGEFDSHGWYVAFGPYERPEIAVVVYLEHGVGATHAAPVARAIFEAYFGIEAAVQR